MSTNRYLLGSRGLVTYGIEGTPYTKATDASTEFGYTNDEVEPPNENPHTPMPTGGVDGPYVNSPDQREHEIDVTTVPTDKAPPLETALGSRTESDVLDPGYEEIIFSEERPLETMTVRHVQTDADMVAYYVGCKSNLDVSFSQGDPVNFDYSITAARQEYDDTEAAPAISSSLPTDVSPYRFHMVGDMTLSNPADSSVIKEVATITAGDLSWDNGLEVNHHGKNDDTDTCREGYSVSEETNAERYDMSVDVKVTDADLYARAANNESAVDVEIPFTRETDGSGNIIDGMFLRLNDCTVTDAPMPNNPEGTIEATIGLLPLSTEIEIRRPL